MFTHSYIRSAVVILMPSIATKMTNTNDWFDVMATPLLSLLLMPGLSLGLRPVVVLLLVVLVVLVVLMVLVALVVLVVLVVLVGAIVTLAENNMIHMNQLFSNLQHARCILVCRLWKKTVASQPCRKL